MILSRACVVRGSIARQLITHNPTTIYWLSNTSFVLDRVMCDPNILGSLQWFAVFIHYVFNAVHQKRVKPDGTQAFARCRLFLSVGFLLLMWSSSNAVLQNIQNEFIFTHQFFRISTCIFTLWYVAIFWFTVEYFALCPGFFGVLYLSRPVFEISCTFLTRQGFVVRMVQKVLNSWKRQYQISCYLRPATFDISILMFWF